jgi:hypothetical protein
MSNKNKYQHPPAKPPKPVATEEVKRQFLGARDPLVQAVLVHFKAAAFRFNLPVSFLLALSAIETNFGTNCKARFGYFNFKSKDQAPHDEHGYNWYGSLPAAAQHMALSFSQYPPWSLHAQEWRRTKDSLKYAENMATDLYGRDTEKRDELMHYLKSQMFTSFD